MRVAAEVEEAMEGWCARHAGRARSPSAPHVAVMGCVVNGPGEARDADIALCGGKGEFMLFVHGQLVGRVPEKEAAAAVLRVLEG